MKTLFIIDIDGTVAHAGKRFREAGPEPSRNDPAVYAVWVNNVQNERSLREDMTVPGMVCMINSLNAGENQAVFLTSREEKWRKVTREWLTYRGFTHMPLVMRPDGNYQESAEFKEDHIRFLKGLYEAANIVVLDDDEHGTIEKKCHDNSWTFLKARSGGQK